MRTCSTSLVCEQCRSCETCTTRRTCFPVLAQTRCKLVQRPLPLQRAVNLEVECGGISRLTFLTPGVRYVEQGKNVGTSLLLVMSLWLLVMSISELSKWSPSLFPSHQPTPARMPSNPKASPTISSDASRQTGKTNFRTHNEVVIVIGITNHHKRKEHDVMNKNIIMVAWPLPTVPMICYTMSSVCQQRSTMTIMGISNHSLQTMVHRAVHHGQEYTPQNNHNFLPE